MSDSLPAHIELEGRRLILRSLSFEDITPRYVSWLNDPIVNRYSRRRFGSATEDDVRRFIEHLAPEERVLAIRTVEEGAHIGNVQFGPVDWHSRRAEIRLLIGDCSVWGRSYGTETIYLVTRYLFERVCLHRVESNSCNPAFIRAVEKLGWTLEGRLRERFPCDGQLLDYLWFGILDREFARRPEFEPAA